VGICHLYGGNYGAELDEFFCGAGGFFWVDYGVFGVGGVAGEAGGLGIENRC
jgi:hypothetical protein